MKKFQKRKEDFVCENCGEKVVGDGFTNHCPKCLFSKHVDVFPGDRKNICKGLMESVGVEQKNGEFVIIFKCEKCGEVGKNKKSEDDNYDKILELVKMSS
jgi:predicted RNA-binding Zn-ribbon protein involved in translation (DUF1610 family)